MYSGDLIDISACYPRYRPLDLLQMGVLPSLISEGSLTAGAPRFSLILLHGTRISLIDIVGFRFDCGCLTQGQDRASGSCFMGNTLMGESTPNQAISRTKWEAGREAVNLISSGITKSASVHFESRRSHGTTRFPSR